MESNRCLYPLFELVGSSCPLPHCTGVLVNYFSIQTRQSYRKCSVCAGKFDIMPEAERLGKAVEIIEKVMWLVEISDQKD